MTRKASAPEPSARPSRRGAYVPLLLALFSACGGQSLGHHGGSADAGNGGTDGGGATGGTAAATGGVTTSGGTGAASTGGTTSVGGTGATGGIVSATGGTAGDECFSTYEDRDGDGWSTYYLSPACGINAGTPAYWEDCDDSDPTRQVTVYLDQDGDGAGTVDHTLCVADGEVPPGYSALSTDCDDLDPSRGPFVIDTPGDGIDQDCDLVDAILCDESLPQGCPCDQLTATIPTSDQACPSFDLALIDVAACPRGCGLEQDYVRIANLGSADFSGVIELRQGAQTETIAATIKAGNITAPRRLLVLTVTYAITLGTDTPGDCNPANDTIGVGEPPASPLPEPICK